MNNKLSGLMLTIAVLLTTILGAGCSGDPSTTKAQPTLAQMCTSSAMQAIMPAGVTVKDIPNLLSYLPAQIRETKSGVVLIGENELGDSAPPYCVVTGSFVTNSATGKTANFAAVFPAADKWNGKYLQIGCGGTCGNVFDAGTPVPAHLRSGYAVWQTDDGHVDGSLAAIGSSVEADSSWAVKSPGVADTDAIDDYLNRAVHTLSVVGRQATASLYSARSVSKSYFLGCSDGGREGMVEATQFPQDFDGIIAGAPYNMPEANLNFMTRALAQLRASDAALSDAQAELVSQAVANCDSADGVADSLVQNPNMCTFIPRRDLPVCAAGQAASGTCLTSHQIDAVTAILAAVRDTNGAVIAAGWPAQIFGQTEASALVFPSAPVAGPDPFGPQPYLTMFNDWSLSNYTIRNLVYAGASDYDGRTTLGQTFVLSDASDPSTFHIEFPQSVASTIASALAKGAWDDPTAMSNFIARGGKLIMYHGLTDPMLNPNNSIRYYENLAASHGGYGALQQNVRLFLAPGMNHCAGGDGPNAFVSQYNAPGYFSSPQVPFDAEHDALAALDAWVENGRTPKTLTAAKYKDDTLSEGITRTMPLCPFPAKATYSGSGAVDDAANWSCIEGDTSMLGKASAGVTAGM